MNHARNWKTQHARRLRRRGEVPAVLYGHGGNAVSLSVPSDALKAVIRHGSRVVALTGAVNEQALLSELQWDVYGTEVLHLDLVRVVEGEKVHLHIAVELRGEAPGAKEGGAVELVMHEIEIDCPVMSIPEKLVVSIRELQLEQHIAAGDIRLPEGATLLTDPEAVVVTCHRVVDQEVEEVPTGETAEPELIGRKPAEEGEEEEA